MNHSCNTLHVCINRKAFPLTLLKKKNLNVSWGTISENEASYYIICDQL